jgi:hypothetical protein
MFCVFTISAWFEQIGEQVYFSGHVKEISLLVGPFIFAPFLPAL